MMRDRNGSATGAHQVVRISDATLREVQNLTRVRLVL